MSRVVPSIHTDKLPLRIGSIRGSYVGDGKLHLEPRGSLLRVRVRRTTCRICFRWPASVLISMVIRCVSACHTFRALVPAPNLIARIVVIKVHSRDGQKLYQEPEKFLEAVRRELARKGIGGKADLPLHEDGPRTGQPRRHVLRSSRQDHRRVLGRRPGIDGRGIREAAGGRNWRKRKDGMWYLCATARKMNMSLLLAKSRPPMSLHDHLQDVREAGAAILQMIIDDLLRAGVPVTRRLNELLAAACLLHDVMKANSAFQQMVQTSGQLPEATDPPWKHWPP